VRRIGVVVPAHNEEDHLGRCLEALLTATRRAGVPVGIVVVLDDCTDGTAAVCRRFPVAAVRIEARSVGRARHAGAMAVLAGEADPTTVWLANTDADTVIPPHWLADQVRLADRGADAVAGIVALPRPTGHPVAAAFDAHYRRRLGPGDAHRHVHGANLGVRASAYLRVGGFAPLRAHEDRQLLAQLEAEPAVSVVRSRSLAVETSDRLSGRCREGFAATLLALSEASVPAA